MQIVVDRPGHYLIAQGEEPEVGRVYELTDPADGTDRQNKAFHALVGEYFRSGCSSYRAKSYFEFRDLIKRDLGAGWEKIIYVDPLDPSPIIHEVKSEDDLPAHVRANKRVLARGRLKSWADYSKKERRMTLDNLVAEMHAAGVQTKHFYEILAGMEERANAPR